PRRRDRTRPRAPRRAVRRRRDPPRGDGIPRAPLGRVDRRQDQAQISVGDAVDRRGDLGGAERARAGGSLRRRVAARGRRRRRPRRRGDQGPGARPHRLARVPRDGGEGTQWVERPLPGVPRGVGALIRVLGIRHHGPGSARSVVAALDELAPDIVLVEGPPDADDLIAYVGLVGDEGLVPPVAILIYQPEAPARAVYYPFARFSPEWQALTWARAHGMAARFMDLPQAHRMAIR